MTSGNDDTDSRDATAETRHNIDSVLDEIIGQYRDEKPFDSYYKKQAEILTDIDTSFFKHVLKRFLRADNTEREALLQLMKHVKGIEHISFLKEFIQKEEYMPRVAMMVLEVFNKSDAILEDGIVSRIIEYDDLAQRIASSAAAGETDTAIVDEFIALDKPERNGIMKQLLQDGGNTFVNFIKILFGTNKAAAEEALSILTSDATPEVFELLSEVYTLTQRKDILKVLKKTAHALNQKGIKVELPGKRTEKKPVFKKAELPESKAFISTIDAEGFRLLFVMKPITPYETKLFNIMASDEKGLVDMEVTTVTRREIQKFIEKITKEEKTEFIEVDIPYVQFILDEACVLTESLGKTVSANMEQWKKLFGDLDTKPEKPIIYNVLPDTECKDIEDSSMQIDQLLLRPEIVFWFLVSSEAKENWMNMLNSIYSPIVIDENQKNERIKQLYRDTAKQFFNTERRRIFKRRLEEFAYFFHAKGKSEVARTALAAACSMEKDNFSAEDNSFCTSLIKKGFEVFETSYNKERQNIQGGNKSGSNIVTS